MVLKISSYVDSGVYIQELVSPQGINIATVPVLPTIIAHGKRSKRATNESVTRALVTAGSLTSFASVTPSSSPASSFTAAKRAVLPSRGNRRLTNTTVYADAVAVSDSYLSFPAAFLLGTSAGPFDLSPVAGLSFSIDLDGQLPITMILKHAAVPVAPVVLGAQVTVEATFSGAGGNAGTRAEVAAAINAGLAAATAVALGLASGGYGATYSSVASDGTTGIKLVSPLTSTSSDVRILAAQGTTGSLTLFGSAAMSADTYIDISDTVYSALATYTIDFISLTDFIDTLSNAGVSAVTRVGAYAGVTTFSKDADYELTGDTLDWSNTGATGPITRATTSSLTASPTFAVGANDTLQLSVDGKAAISIDLIQASGSIHGFTYALVSPLTPAQVATNINAILANDARYGARYNNVASVSASKVVLTSPNDTTASSIAITHPTSNDATNTIFGLSSGVNRTVTGSGTRPASGSVYFASYEYTRPAGDYNNPKQFFNIDQALEFTGPVAEDNPLSVAAQLAFENRAPTILLVQVDDATTTGAPTTLEYQAALTATEQKSSATDVVILSSDLTVQVALMQHVEAQSSPTEKNYRRGWFGMARNTPIGDKDTPDTYVYRSARTLQLSADSPGRGRLILVASPGIEGISKTIVKEDASQVTMDLDSTWLALGILCRMASFASPAEALARKTIAGFDITEGDFTPWVRSERAAMASKGVTVVTYDAGRLILLDPITTERAGGGVISFEQISASTQKDNITRKVTQALDANIVGLVPTDLADFIVDIKLTISNVLAGEIGSGAIGPFKDIAGNTRPIDLMKDINVQQDPNDPTKFLFKFYFQLRYPALRLFGEFSVANVLANQSA